MSKKKKVEKEKNLQRKERPELGVLPHVDGLSEAAMRVLKKHGISSAFKPANTIGQHLFRLKDTSQSADTIYKINGMNYS